MNKTNYIIVLNKQCLCPEVYRKSISNHYLFSKRTVPCLFTFDNHVLCNRFVFEMSHYSFDEVFLADYDKETKFKTPNDMFNMYQDVTLNGFVKKKQKTLDTFTTSSITTTHSNIINKLVYTQSLIMYSIKSFVIHQDTQDESIINLSIQGILLEPILDDLDDEQHLQIIKKNLESSYYKLF